MHRCVAPKIEANTKAPVEATSRDLQSKLLLKEGLLPALHQVLRLQIFSYKPGITV